MSCDDAWRQIKSHPNVEFADLDALIVQADGRSIPELFAAEGEPAFRALEVMGIEQARAWGVCSMNDFRAFLGLKRFDTFEEWNSDPAVAVWS